MFRFVHRYLITNRTDRILFNIIDEIVKQIFYKGIAKLIKNLVNRFYYLRKLMDQGPQILK